MREFNNLTFGTANVVCLGITAVLLFLIPIVFWLVWRRTQKGQLKYKYLMAGAIGFLVSARVLELGVHYLCLISDNPVSRWINGNTAAYVLYGIIMAGVFEECGRYIILKHILKKDRTRENAVLYGIGHGGIEVWLVVLPSVAAMLAFALLFSAGNVSEALSTLNITEETATQAFPAALAASQFGVGVLALNAVERIFAMGAHIGLSVIVFYGVSRNKMMFLPLAILLHMIMDIFAGLYQRGAVPMWLSEVWFAGWTAIILFIAVKLYGKVNYPPAKASG